MNSQQVLNKGHTEIFQSTTGDAIQYNIKVEPRFLIVLTLYGSDFARLPFVIHNRRRHNSVQLSRLMIT